MSNKLLKIEGLSHSFGSVKVLKGISLDVGRGEFVAIVGPSGCGKTTLLNLISGFYKPDSGTVTRTGTIRMVYQHGGLLPWLSAAENIALGLRHVADEMDRMRQVKELLKVTRLEEFSDHFPHQLSGGMQRRVELARVLASDADLVLMDEPFSALDYQTRLRMRREFIRVLQGQSRTTVLVTHDLEEAVLLADRILVLSDRPAQFGLEVAVDLQRPRDVTHPLVVEALRNILNKLHLQDSCVEETGQHVFPAEIAATAAGSLTAKAL